MPHCASETGWRPANRALTIAIAIALMAVSAYVTLVLTDSGQAQAHDSPESCIGVYYGGVQRAVSCANYSHRDLAGCDRYADGLRARAWVIYGPITDQGYWDPNGANSGCAHNWYPATFQYHRICVEQPVGCSAWKIA